MTSLWTGQFGDDYTARQPANIDDRREFWRAIMPKHVTSILEIGANVGLNLEAISQFSTAEMYACEPNDMARQRLLFECKAPNAHVTPDRADQLSFRTASVDLALTCGVLIHIPADRLLPSMREIHRVSRQWIITAEYFSPSEEMIPYRGHDNALWRRDYGSIWMDNFPDLRCEGCIFAWKRITGMDNLTVWILEKTNVG